MRLRTNAHLKSRAARVEGAEALDPLTASAVRVMTAAEAKRARPRRAATRTSDAGRRGATALVDCYQGLARTRSHLLEPILQGAPTQWEHYPAEDAIGLDRRYQWYYHSHSLADRPGTIEHGHFHLFARPEGTGGQIDASAESSFLGTLGASDSDAGTRHLLAIGMNPVGVPISLFTVNRWVTGDLLLSRSSTLVLLESMELNTGYPTIDAVLTTLSQLYRPEIRFLMSRRDAALRARAAKGPGTLDDTRVEVLSEVSLDIDQRIANALTDGV